MLDAAVSVLAFHKKLRLKQFPRNKVATWVKYTKNNPAIAINGPKIVVVQPI